MEYIIIDNINIISVELDGTVIANFQKRQTSLKTDGDKVVLEYEDEAVGIPFDQCSDPDEASVEDLRVSVLDILNNLPSESGGLSSAELEEIEVASGDFSGNDYTDSDINGKTIEVFVGGTKLERGTEFTHTGSTLTILSGATDCTIVFIQTT
jgi:hypothetical protein